MSGIKGMKHYPESFKLQIKAESDAGASMKSLHRKYGVSIYSIESWCGLRPEVWKANAAVDFFIKRIVIEFRIKVIV